MVKGIQAALVVCAGVAFTLGITQCGAGVNPYLDPARPSQWGEYGTLLQREVGPLRYLGGVSNLRGGSDVYAADDGEWWIVGPGRRWTKCRPERAGDVSDQHVREEYFRDPLPASTTP